MADPASRRLNPRSLIAVGIVFTILGGATAIWRSSKGESTNGVLGLVTGGLIVLGIGLYLEMRDRRSS